MKLSRAQFDILVNYATTNEFMTKKNIEDLTGLDRGDVERYISELSDLNYITNGAITTCGMDVLEQYRVKRAIFIAAGFGSRLLPITINTPKPLVRVHGIRIIDRLIDACIAADINDIYIVRGYLSEMFDQLLPKYPMIKFVDNKAYNEANNIRSSLLVCDILQNAYVFEADLLISNPKLIQKYHYTSNFLGIKKKRTDDWCVRVKNRIIQEERIGGEGDDIWQLIGISYWDTKDGCKLKKDIPDVYASPGGKERYWEQVPLVYRKEDYKVEIRECFDADIVEIDTFSELKAIDKAYNV